MPKRRRLTDIMRTGKSVVFPDPEGDVEVWLQKPNKIEMDNIYRRANAAKARYAERARDHDSDEWMSSYAAVMDIDDFELSLRLAMASDMGRAKARTEVQVELDEDGEWMKDDYLQGLFDAWNGDEENQGLKLAYALDPEAETPDGQEAKRILDELERFRQSVEDAFKPIADEIEATWRAKSVDDVLEAACQQFVDNQAQDVFAKEFTRQQVFYACREPDDHLKKYFGTLDELDECDDSVRLRLDLEVGEFTLDVTEGKDSPATPDGSPPSEPPATEGVSQDSGPVDAPA